MVPELKAVHSPELEYGKLPQRPLECEVRMEAAIGAVGVEAADRFRFTVITHRALLKQEQHLWGRGYLVVSRFSWPEIERALDELLSAVSGPTWAHIAVRLNRQLIWDHDF